MLSLGMTMPRISDSSESFSKALSAMIGSLVTVSDWIINGLYRRVKPKIIKIIPSTFLTNPTRLGDLILYFLCCSISSDEGVS